MPSITRHPRNVLPRHLESPVKHGYRTWALDMGIEHGYQTWVLNMPGVQELGDDPSLTVRTSIAITFSFLYLFVASGLLGAAFGLTAALLLKASPSIHVHQVRSCHSSCPPSL